MTVKKGCGRKTRNVLEVLSKRRPKFHEKNIIDSMLQVQLTSPKMEIIAIHTHRLKEHTSYKKNIVNWIPQ